MANKVDFKTVTELECMHTGSLMSRRKALLQCEDSFRLSDRYGYEENPNASIKGVIEFKDTPEWKQAYTDLKSILVTRENILNKQERKIIRQNKAKAAK